MDLDIQGLYGVYVWRQTKLCRMDLHAAIPSVVQVVDFVVQPTLGYPQAIRCDCVDTKLCRVDLHAAVPNVVRGRTPSL